MKRRNFFRSISISLLLLWGISLNHEIGLSATPPQTKNGDEMTSKTSILAQKLINREYGQFFYYPAHFDTLRAIWNTPGNPELLEILVNDQNASTEARFLASEVLLFRDFDFLSRTDLNELANVYTTALVNNFTGIANSWGFLYEFDDMGSVGIVFLTLGKSALPALVKFLDNDNIPARYIGSEEATIGYMYRFRVKDFAAFYISKITNFPIEFHQEWEKHDQEIERLKRFLNQQ